MNKHAIFPVICLIGLLLLISGIIYFFSSFSLVGEAECKILFESPSPDGRYIATAFYWYGGAVISTITQVSIRPAQEKWDAKSNAIVLSEHEIDQVQVDWSKDDQLTIHFSSPEVHLQVPQWRDVSITFVRESK